MRLMCGAIEGYLRDNKKATFGMYSGSERRVKIRFANRMCGVFIDRFGKDIDFHKVDDDHSEFNVDVNVSPQFFGWIFSLGTDVKIAGPADVVKEMKDYTKQILENMK